MNRKAMFFGPQGVSFNYTTVFYAYTLQKIITWNNAVLKLRRTSDNATAWVFFDGSTITLSSLISTSSNTTPDATTLATWVGASDAYAAEWIPLEPSGTITSSAVLTMTTAANQPKFITAGAIITASSNSMPTIDFLSDLRFLRAGTSFGQLAESGNATVASVSGNNNATGIGTIACNRTSSSQRWVMFNDNRTTGGVYVVGLMSTSVTDYRIDLLAAGSTSDQKLLTTTKDGTSKAFYAYLNGVEQDNITWTGTQDGNNPLQIGIQFSNNTPLNGNIQELILFSSVLSTDDLTDLHNDIKSRYGI